MGREILKSTRAASVFAAARQRRIAAARSLLAYDPDPVGSLNVFLGKVAGTWTVFQTTDSSLPQRTTFLPKQATGAANHSVKAADNEIHGNIALRRYLVT